ncbi:hypothetical protein PUNSTDRAFT_70864, partial [Punctularia strigosozonata HHB-11173 SS5]|uniref:uncharacterized protein n=1 Tax=Punctularia strigosozonata (strain HHB-11173) TaxID=741275 RepID=UPI00044171FF
VNDYGARASKDLIVTRGDGFRKEKNKKKRGSYRGGEITVSFPSPVIRYFTDHISVAYSWRVIVSSSRTDLGRVGHNKDAATLDGSGTANLRLAQIDHAGCSSHDPG